MKFFVNKVSQHTDCPERSRDNQLGCERDDSNEMFITTYDEAIMGQQFELCWIPENTPGEVTNSECTSYFPSNAQYEVSCRFFPQPGSTGQYVTATGYPQQQIDILPYGRMFLTLEYVDSNAPPAPPRRRAYNHDSDYVIAPNVGCYDQQGNLIGSDVETIYGVE